MDVRDLINIDPEVLGGQPVFRGTRVPIESLFDHLEQGVTVDDFLDQFPSVSKKQAIAVLEIVGKMMSSKNVVKLYEAAA